MHAIDSPGSINGTFTEGNRGIGQRATQVSADWLNDIQANLLKLMAEAKIAPTKGRASDLLEAIKIIATGVGGGGAGGGGVPSARKISVAGGLLTTSGEDLSQDRTLTLAAASAAEIIAGALDSKVLTPKGLFEAMTANIAGRSVTVGPITIKVGDNLALMRQGPVYTAFAVPFPNECWGVFPVARNDTSGTNRDIWPQLVGAPGRDGFTVMIQDSSSAGDRTCDGFSYVAIGR